MLPPPARAGAFGSRELEVGSCFRMLTVSWALPLAGALLLLLVGNADGRRDEPHSLARAGGVAGRVWSHPRSLGRVRCLLCRVPVRRTRVVDSGIRHRLLPRRRRDQSAPGRAHGLSDADCAALVVGIGREEGQGVLDLRPGPRGCDDRGLRVARPVPLLRLLGRHAHPDVLPHRDLGLRPAHLRGRQVHALHDGGQRADADRDPGAGVPPQRGDGQLQLRSHQAVHARPARPKRSAGSSSRSQSPLRSKSRSFRSTPGCPTRTCRRPLPVRSSWPACC